MTWWISPCTTVYLRLSSALPHLGTFSSFLFPPGCHSLFQANQTNMAGNATGYLHVDFVCVTSFPHVPLGDGLVSSRRLYQIVFTLLCSRWGRTKSWLARRKSHSMKHTTRYGRRTAGKSKSRRLKVMLSTASTSGATTKFSESR